MTRMAWAAMNSSKTHFNMRCSCGGQDFKRISADELRVKSYELA